MNSLKKVWQTKFGLTDGNCFEACVASLTGISIDSIPDFEHTENWLCSFFVWMEEQGFSVQQHKDPLQGNFFVSAPTYVIGADSTHAVILTTHTSFKGQIQQTHFSVCHDPLHKDLNNSDFDANKLLYILTINKGANK